MSYFPDKGFWNDKSVLVTGHTGFKGGWIAHWLGLLGAKVHGYSLAPPTEPSFFIETKLESRVTTSTLDDVRNLATLTKTMDEASPEIVIHMAAQPLVREAYRNPLDTFEVNLMGTVNLLESARRTPSVKAIVVVTTDKCYRNNEWIWPYRENDRLGGSDPYSASKAITELAVASYRDSFLSEANIHVATARAGNVIGGGDWSRHRLIPDFLRALESGTALKVRSGGAVRPWQHVLEPLAGYLRLAEVLHSEGSAFAGPWNFGPNDDSHKPVSWVVERLQSLRSSVQSEEQYGSGPRESQLLALDSSKAKTKIGWGTRWDLETALTKTVEWHEAWMSGEDMSATTTAQIENFLKT